MGGRDLSVHREERLEHGPDVLGSLREDAAAESEGLSLGAVETNRRHLNSLSCAHP